MMNERRHDKSSTAGNERECRIENLTTYICTCLLKIVQEHSDAAGALLHQVGASHLHQARHPPLQVRQPSTAPAMAALQQL
jgi:hypothetical protein